MRWRSPITIAVIGTTVKFWRENPINPFVFGTKMVGKEIVFDNSFWATLIGSNHLIRQNLLWCCDTPALTRLCTQTVKQKISNGQVGALSTTQYYIIVHTVIGSYSIPKWWFLPNWMWFFFQAVSNNLRLLCRWDSNGTPFFVYRNESASMVLRHLDQWVLPHHTTQLSVENSIARMP